jgi:hypothetical protein
VSCDALGLSRIVSHCSLHPQPDTASAAEQKASGAPGRRGAGGAPSIATPSRCAHVHLRSRARAHGYASSFNKRTSTHPPPQQVLGSTARSIGRDQLAARSSSIELRSSLTFLGSHGTRHGPPTLTRRWQLFWCLLDALAVQKVAFEPKSPPSVTPDALTRMLFRCYSCQGGNPKDAGGASPAAR